MFKAQTNGSEINNEEAYILNDTFIAASENGFLFRERREDSWTCAVSGTLGTLECVGE